EGRVARHDSESIIRHAWRFLHAPYLWGGKTAFGIDCSGLMQVIFNCAGIDLPRDAYQQATVGESVDFVDMTEPGDLVFFDNEEQRITHVGVVIEKERILHASGCVRIDKLDHQGIFNADVNSYTHKLRLIRRVIPG
ncbi:MAG TPA: C40 family peptidase, partial [Cryomorphaceae bacterium]|nr:C40 family peptidase [Cryomorphaceae bacterium]